MIAKYTCCKCGKKVESEVLEKSVVARYAADSSQSEVWIVACPICGAANEIYRAIR